MSKTTNIPIPLHYWEGHKNFGDELSPYVVSKLTGKKVVYADKFQRNKLVAIGSLLHRDLLTSESTIWGTGCIRPTILNLKVFPINKFLKTFYRTIRYRFNSKICAVRGPLTREALQKVGINSPEIYGDPAILLPLLYTPTRDPSINGNTIGLILHHSQENLISHKDELEERGIKIISIYRSGNIELEKFIDEITSCKCIYSSSLHGIITSQAYGIDTQWINFKDVPIHKFYDFKFIDYFLGSNQTIQKPLTLNSFGIEDISTILRERPVKTNKFANREKLIDAFPTDLK